MLGQLKITLISLLSCLVCYHALPLRLSSFRFQPTPPQPPRLVLITGCTGTGKSTFGMNVALAEGIVKCISTDTIREVMRKFDANPALHRSSYVGSTDPVQDWIEASKAVDVGVNAMVFDLLNRGQSVVLEGVHIRPGRELIDAWEAAGGSATGVVLRISDGEAHRKLISRRGDMLGKGADQQLLFYERIRAIQDGMISLAEQADWKIIEQELN